MFTVFTVIIALASFAKAVPPPSMYNPHGQRIVGGEEISINNAPYTACLLRWNFPICGGTIISDKFIVTAAHCTHKQGVYALSVRVNSNFDNKGGQKIRVKKIFMHPEYSEETLDYDVAVIELMKEIRNAKPAILAKSLPDVDTPCLASGWGVTKEGRNDIPSLMAVSLPVADTAVCKNVYGKWITENMMCAGDLNGGKDTCQGDSGGPLVCNNELVGIVSFGSGCARPGKLGVYTSVPKLIDWIEEHAQM